MPFSLLPLELLDLITDGLRDDVPSLKSCTLSFRSLRFSAQRHLFGTVYLTASSGAHVGSCEALHNVLLQSPHLATHVRELRLYDGQEGSCSPLFWLMEHNNIFLPALLERLTNLRNMHIHNYSQTALIWHQLPSPIQQCLLKALASPRLRSLTLIKLAFWSTTEYMSIFEHSLGLKELYMWVACCLVGPRASFVSNADNGYEGEALIPRFRPQFETIWMKMSAGALGEQTAYPDTDYCINAFLHPRATLDTTTSLRKFCISIHPEDDHWAIQPQIDRAQNLEELVVEMDVFAARGLDLSRIPKVYLISLFTLNGLNEIFYGKHSREVSRLEELTIEYDISGLDVVFAEMSGFDDMDWCDFEEKMLISARKVTFVICGRTACPLLRKFFLERLPVHLPRLRVKGILSVEYVADPPSHGWETRF